MLATTMEAEPEVMGTPGRVADMIARFSHLATTTPATVTIPVIKRNGTSPVDYDVTDNVMMTGQGEEEDDVRPVFRPVIKDLTLGDPHNNNNKLYKVDHTKQTVTLEEEESADNVIMNYRKKLRPVANSVILAENCVDNDVTDVDSPLTSPGVMVNGSEPSLLSRNGQRSSTTASKRTLVSQDPSPPHPHHPHKVDGENRSSSQPTLLDNTMPGTTDPALDPALDTPPKTPSYMKISCALSGYNRYNTYTSPKQEAKLKVIKLSEQNGSHSSLSSQSDCSSTAEVRNNSDLSIKVVEDNHPNNSVVNKHEPLKNGLASSEHLQNGSRHSSHSNSNSISGGGVTTNGADRQPAAIVTNGRTTLDDDDEEDDSHKFVTMATVNLQPASSPTATTLTTPLATSGTTTSSGPELKLQWEDKRKTDLRSAVSTPSPSKDGHYYFPVLDREVSRIRALCAQCEQDMQNNALPEEVSGKIRATIGKSNLLVDKKFQQFRGLCERNISQASDEQFQTTVTDLAGFWDMVSLQVSDINTMFDEIDKMRQAGWKVVRDSPVKQTSTKVGAKSTKSRTKDTTSMSTPVKSSSAKAGKASEAAKARDEARKRLLAAKRAGRQRKISESDKDEIEIFVAK